MSDVYDIEIEAEVDCDGVTPLQVTISDFERVGGRHYKLKVPGPFGIIPANFFGLFSATTPKLVGVASRTWNPMNVARIVSGEDVDEFRQELDITPRLQHAGMFGGDRIAVKTNDGNRTKIYLTVNEMSDENHVRFALANRERHQWRRFRIIRDTGTGFIADFSANPWIPQFAWHAGSNMLVTHDNGEGPIPIRALGLYPRNVGCFYTVRFANVDTHGQLNAYEPETGTHRILDEFANMTWSKVQFGSHDDHLVLASHGPIQGTKVVADIEVTRARPIDRVRGRWTREA